MGNAHTIANNKYQQKAYDRVTIVLPKGQKADLQGYCSGRSVSLNAYIIEAIKEKQERERLTND
jgi:hypothetical protein